MIKHWTTQNSPRSAACASASSTAPRARRTTGRSPEELALYDSTFGERIGWKWDAVLRELAARGWQPQSRHVLDWGCGSGIAGRRVLAEWPHLETLALHDRSPSRLRFAAEKARAAAKFRVVDVRELRELAPDTLLVVSHVINELPPPRLPALLALARQAREIIWVEAGTHADSRRLIASARVVAAAEFAAVAPCTHQARCGMLTPENAPHWCHHFAPPLGDFSRWALDGIWPRTGDRSAEPALQFPRAPARRRAAPMPPDFSRVIGEPREANGYCKILSCHEMGVRELMLQKRDAPELHRAFHKGTAASTCRWTMASGRIVGANPL